MDEDFEEELEEDNLEEEMEMIQKTKPAQKVKPNVRKAAGVATTEEEVAEQTYEIYAQPERIGIKDSRTGESIAEGFKDSDGPILMLLERILNQLDKIAIASGAQ